MKKAHITITVSLILLVTLSLFFALLHSAKLSAGRAVSALALDDAVYSLFSCYDRDLSSLYGVFLLDGSGTGSTPSLTKFLSFLEDAASQELSPEMGTLLPAEPLLALSLEETGIRSYTLAGEGNGAAYLLEVRELMEDTLAIRGVRSLLGQVSAPSLAAQEAEGEAILSEDPAAKMREIEQAAGAEETAGASAENASGAEGADPPSAAVPADFEDPTKPLAELRKMDLLALVLPEGRTVSSLALPEDRPSRRQSTPSMGAAPDTASLSSLSSKALIGEYVLSYTGCFTGPAEEGVLSYGAEYILSGKENDADALRAVLRKLLLIRTGANALHIMTDAVLRAQAEETGLLIASSLGVPAAAPAAEAVLVGLWAYGESLVDVRALLAGKRIPLRKDAGSWQLSLDNIPALIHSPDALTKDTPGGLSYRDYLLSLLSLQEPALTGPRLLDLAEGTIRTARGRPAFRIDHCVVSLTAFMEIRSESSVTFDVTSRFSYLKDPA